MKTSRIFIFSLVLSALMLVAPTRVLAEGVWHPLGYNSSFVMSGICQVDSVYRFTPTETGYYRFTFSTDVWSHIVDEEFYGREKWGNQYGGLLYGKTMTTYSKLTSGHHYELHISTARNPRRQPTTDPIAELTVTVTHGETSAVSSTANGSSISVTIPAHSEKYVSYTSPYTTQMKVLCNDDHYATHYKCLVRTGDGYTGLRSWCYTDRTIYNMKADEEYVMMLTNCTDETRDVTLELVEDDTPVLTGSITIETIPAKARVFYRFIPSETGRYEFGVDAENTTCLAYTFYPEGNGWEEGPKDCIAGKVCYVRIMNKNKSEITNVKLNIKKQKAESAGLQNL